MGLIVILTYILADFFDAALKRALYTYISIGKMIMAVFISREKWLIPEFF